VPVNVDILCLPNIKYSLSMKNYDTFFAFHTAIKNILCKRLQVFGQLLPLLNSLFMTEKLARYERSTIFAVLSPIFPIFKRLP